MATCGQLKRGLAAPCKPGAAGLRTEGILIRLDDIAGVTRNSTVEKGVVIAMKAGKKGFLVQGLGESNAGRSKIARGKYGPAFSHEYDCVAFGSGADELQFVDELGQDKVVAVNRDNNGHIRVYGLNGGLVLTKADFDTANKDTGGGAELTLTGENEIGSGDLFMAFDGQNAYDPAATLTAYEALVTRAEVV
jgi:hypothetical protein